MVVAVVTMAWRLGIQPVICSAFSMACISIAMGVALYRLAGCPGDEHVVSPDCRV